MTRWILLGSSIFGFALVLVAKSVSLLALGLVLGVVGMIGFVFALAAARIASGSRPDAAMASPEDLATLGKRPAAARRDAGRGSV